jgi:hypothetical protein
VTELVSTPEGTDLIYEVEWQGEHGLHVEGDRVVLHGASTDPACRPGGMSVSVREGKLVCTRSLPPVQMGATHVEVEIAGDAGEWRIRLDLEPFGAESQSRRELTTSDTQGDITIAVDSIVRTPGAVVLELRAYTTRPQVQLSIGGLSGMRDASTAMRLHDDRGRTFVEQFRQDARDQLPGHVAGSDVAIFAGVPDDASDLTLEVPYVCGTEYGRRAEIHVPATEPLSIELTGTTLRVMGSRPAELPGARGPAIALDFERGAWENDRRVIAPLQATLDDTPCGLSWVGGINGPAPEAVPGVLIPCPTPAESHVVALSGAFTQQRGPWRIHLGSAP